MNLLRSKRNVIAQQMRIKPENFRWYAAFHDAGHHPHVHLMAYSIDPKEAYLTEMGIEAIKGELAKEIFRQDHISIYQKQTQYRDQLRQQGGERVTEIVEQINAGEYRNERVEDFLRKLSIRLAHTSGKKPSGPAGTAISGESAETGARSENQNRPKVPPRNRREKAGPWHPGLILLYAAARGKL